MEAQNIASEIENKKEEIISGIRFISGSIYGKEVVTAVCGVGKVFAAACAEAMILRYSPDEIINVGVAGSLVPRLHVFDAVLASDLCQHDMDTSALGDEPGLISGINMVKFPASLRINTALEACLVSNETHFITGTIASGDCFVADPAKKAYINRQFGAVACEMEGAAIAQVCYINNVEFAVLRSISDENGGDYEKFARRAADNSAAVIREYLKLDK